MNASLLMEAQLSTIGPFCFVRFCAPVTLRHKMGTDCTAGANTALGRSGDGAQGDLRGMLLQGKGRDNSVVFFADPATIVRFVNLSSFVLTWLRSCCEPASEGERCSKFWAARSRTKILRWWS